MIFGVTGTKRGLSNKQIENFFEFIRFNNNIEELHHGDCIGVDVQVALIMRELIDGIVIAGHPPDDDKLRGFFDSDIEFDKEPFLVRNRNIVKKIDLLLAFPFERKEQLRSGTWATIRYAKKAGIPIEYFFN